MSTMPIYALVDTWNSAGTVFTGIGLNVTDTASAAGSLLLDLQVGGVSRFSVTKAGVISAGTLALGSLTGLGTGVATFLATPSSANLATAVTDETGTGALVFATSPTLSSPNISAATLLTFGGTTSSFPSLKRSGTTLAVRLADDTADAPLTASALVSTASPVNTTSIAALGYSLTGSDASSLLDVSGTWDTTGTPTLLKANVTDTASNAASLLLDLQVGGTSRVAVTKGGHIVQAGSYHEMAEMTAPAAPATNGVRIYAEDNGSGKTRLMARFATGAAVQIAIEP
jgi:hypothetical protein